MKLLFLCNANVENKNINCASWIEGILYSLDLSFEILIAGVGTDFKGQFEINGKTYGFVGIADASEDKIQNIIKEFLPDVTVIFGTEFNYSYSGINAAKAAGVLDKTVVFSQGFCSVCAYHYAEGVPQKVINRYTFRDFVRRENIKTEIKKLQKKSENEKYILKTTKNLIGRTRIDNALLRLENDTADYFQCNDILRKPFYFGKWNYDDCKKHSIFISQYYYPLKGFHFLLEAVSLIKNKYPDICVVAAGYNPINKLEYELKDSSYIRYIKKLIKKYELENNIVFTGNLNAEEMKNEYLKSNVFVISSTIENSPNSLAEAMILGVPSIASDVGGITDFAIHKKEALIYPSTEPKLLAYYIDDVFSQRENAGVLGNNAYIRALKDFDADMNINRISDIFRQIEQKGTVK